jgi:cold-inducible RNA-binding protein
MKIYVGNLSFQTTDTQLQEAFGAYGEVSSVAIITDKFSGRSRGFAFVEFGSDDEGNAAIEGLNGKELDGRTLQVNVARPREERGNRGGGYNRRDKPRRY